MDLEHLREDAVSNCKGRSRNLRRGEGRKMSKRYTTSCIDYVSHSLYHLCPYKCVSNEQAKISGL